MSQRRFWESQEQLALLHQEDPDNAAYTSALALSEAHCGLWKKAKQLLTDQLHHYPEDALAQKNLRIIEDKEDHTGEPSG